MGLTFRGVLSAGTLQKSCLVQHSLKTFAARPLEVPTLRYCKIVAAVDDFGNGLVPGKSVL